MEPVQLQKRAPSEARFLIARPTSEICLYILFEAKSIRPLAAHGGGQEGPCRLPRDGPRPRVSISWC